MDQRGVAAPDHVEERAGVGEHGLDAGRREAFGLGGVALVERVDLGRDDGSDFGVGVSVGGQGRGGEGHRGGGEGVAKAFHGVLR
jgi:hypothetical protein